MRPGAVERLGLGYDVVAKVNPRMIYVAASAYGRTGPMAQEAGIDPTVQSFCGWCSITGPENGRGEMFRHLAHLDLTTATTITQAVLQALIARERTGKGQRIEIEMLTAAMAMQTTRLAEYFATGVQPPPLGSAAATTAPHQAFECQDRKYIAIGVERDEQWPGFCRALKLDDLISDPRFSTNSSRVRNRAELAPILAERFKTKPAAWWTIRLNQEKVPNGPFLNFDEAAQPSAGSRQRPYRRNRYAALGPARKLMDCRGSSSARRRVRFAQAASRASIPRRYSPNSASSTSAGQDASK